MSKNTQAYFGECRMLRTGFVFDEPLRTPTYSIKFHTQEYFAIWRRCSPRRVCETQISKNTQAYRSGHNEAVLKTVRGNSHGGSNPSACAIKTNTIPRGWCLFLYHSQGEEPVGFAYPTRRSKSSLFRRRVWVSSSKTNTPSLRSTSISIEYLHNM